ncbi:alpha-ketoacid dehydrogenase subunit beta [Brevundimonas sp. Root1423]|uniref:alpha-ketoacid dehydrogenase subunit beta n=1 Tax=Brevundimonas sp. Root1423 TaxID=1736462 RepID=UPI00351493ED
MVDQNHAPKSEAPGNGVQPMNMIQALNSAIDIKMTEDPNVLSFGEDAGYFGGVFRVTDHLQKKHGLTRSFDAPISECGIVAAAIGAKLRYRSGGQFTSPITVRSPYGGGIFGGQTHSQSPESLFTHIAGLKVVIPSNPYDAKGLLTAAIEDDDPVIFFEPKRLYNGPFDGWHQKPVSPWKAQELAQVPTGKYVEPIGKARIMREGADVTILCYGTMVWVSLAGAEHAGVDAEVIDLRTLVPLDIETIEASVKKTGRCVIVHEAPKTSGFGGELSALVQERCFYHLEAPIARVTGWDTPYPHAFEWEYFPGPERVALALKAVMTGGR